MTEYSSTNTRQVTGTVYDIKRFAIHDGPGIRTTVFLKGCPLACSWCHNPESQAFEPQLLVDEDRCIGCGTCVAVCKQGAIRLSQGIAQTSPEICVACGACAVACTQHLRRAVGECYSVPQLLKIIEADSIFYSDTGGVTLSGGEPLAQPELAIPLLQTCSERRVHTAVDTCGYVESDVLRSAAEFADLFLFDLKHMDDKRHRAATGESNQLILDNTRRLDELGASMWIRIPLIPGFNDDMEHLMAMCRFIVPLRGVLAVQLLPYHRGGEGKREQLGLPGSVHLEPHSPESLERILGALRRNLKVPVSVGG
ncbi:glycyl-radical enzyme activating protein [Candidatus Bipolaricaulota bacterium]